MARLVISKADLLKNQPTPPGWYRAEIAKMILEQSKDKKSYNFVVDFRIEENDKEIKTWFNTGMIQMAAPMVEAATGIAIDPTKDIDVDTDDLVGKKIQVHIINDTYQGRIVDKIDNYADYNADMSVPFV